MNTREQAIEAAAAGIGTVIRVRNGWAQGAAAAALAASLPALLNDLADSIEADAAGATEDFYSAGLSEAARTVRAAAERWA